MAATPPAAGLPAEVQAMINISLGGIVVSTFFSFLTMGIILTCAWTYFEKYPKDPWAFKALVSLCMAMSIGDTVGTGLWCYDWAVAGYANPTVMGITHWAFPLEAFLLGTTSLVVQWFFAWRLWMISMKKHWWLSAIICALSTLAWCIVVWMVHILATHKLVADLQLVLPTVYIWLGGSVAADVLITCSMMYYLDLRYRSKHAQQHLPTQGRFRAIIFRTMECNVLSLIAQIVTVALFNRPEVGFYFVLTDMTLAKVYTFSLLVSLNGRHSDGTDKSTSETSKGVESHVLADRRGVRPPNTQVSIQVQQQTDDGSDTWPKDGDADDFDSDRKVKLDSMA